MQDAAQPVDLPVPGVPASGRPELAALGAADRSPRVFGLAGFSGAGKTTLLEQLIPRLSAGGRRIAVLKHTHHAVETDIPGKDSWRHREAGACEVMLANPRRWVLTHSLRDAEGEPALDALLRHFSPCDLIIVEGYKRAPIAKLEVYRAGNGKPMLHVDDPHVVAIASDAPLATSLPNFGLDDYDGIAAFIEQYVGMGRAAAAAVR